MNPCEAHENPHHGLPVWLVGRDTHRGKCVLSWGLNDPLRIFLSLWARKKGPSGSCISNIGAKIRCGEATCALLLQRLWRMRHKFQNALYVLFRISVDNLSVCAVPHYSQDCWGVPLAYQSQPAEAHSWKAEGPSQARCDSGSISSQKELWFRFAQPDDHFDSLWVKEDKLRCVSLERGPAHSTLNGCSQGLYGVSDFSS